MVLHGAQRVPPSPLHAPPPPLAPRGRPIVPDTIAPPRPSKVPRGDQASPTDEAPQVLGEANPTGGGIHLLGTAGGVVPAAVRGEGVDTAAATATGDGEELDEGVDKVSGEGGDVGESAAGGQAPDGPQAGQVPLEVVALRVRLGHHAHLHHHHK